MKTRTAELSPLFRARLAGILYLIANLPAPFALVYLPARLIVRGDAAATANNIMASESLFRLGIVGLLFNSIANLLLVLALYQLLKVVNKSMASLMVMFVLAAVPIAMLNELNQIAVLQLLSGADYLQVFTREQLQSLAYMFLRFHSQGLSIAMIFWGLWLFPMGYLIFKSDFMPRILGILLMIGCFGYVIESFASVLGYNVSIIFFTSWGELLLLLWLLIKGVNVEQWQKHAAASAHAI
jgi:hypothetical protein